MTDTQPRDLSAPLVHTLNLTKQFGSFVAVDNVTLAIPQGTIFGFIGPSGCGKTTTVRLLLGIYKPTSGSASVLGREPENFSRRDRERLGYMPQLFVLYPALTVWENLNFAASLYGVPLRRGKRLKRLLELVELDGDRGKSTEKLSGGMQRRLSLAAALVNDPELLFLDEPTAGIDPVLRRKFWDYFKEMQEEGRTVFVTTQYVGEAAYCDLVGVMAEGRLLTVDTPDGLRRQAIGGEVVEVRLAKPLNQELVRRIRDLPFVRGEFEYKDPYSFQLVVEDASVAIPDLIEWFGTQGLEVESSREYLLPFDDVFVRLIEQRAMTRSDGAEETGS